MTLKIKQMDDLVGDLRLARAALKLAKDGWDKAKAILNDSSEKAAYDNAQEGVNAVDQAIRAMAEEIYEETKETDIHPAVGIRMKTETVVDWKAALEWCRTEMPAMLVVDQKAFMAYVKSSKSLPDFVLQEKVPQVTIATDIDKAMKAANPPAPPDGDVPF